MWHPALARGVHGRMPRSTLSDLSLLPALNVWWLELGLAPEGKTPLAQACGPLPPPANQRPHPLLIRGSQTLSLGPAGLKEGSLVTRENLAMICGDTLDCCDWH